ncbi:hypothetical protein Nepgr_027839 [Nepenthes gracilis]|uniref:CW-type domain-containing protein n=1 Tax=Nepenthes gracilis TaxID=150966 RepID=A0AAD3Y3Z2_NEPGR|nr:hypothetical protein Nepgr_027839 [Nepenthes gracilis]
MSRWKEEISIESGGEKEMDENELEEGEACSYRDDDTSIDPDVDFSYLDEKVQYVLGHFKKDFEGGVSAENLGAKFGGYGSFLPVYQRSPIPHSRPKVQNLNTPRSPNNSQVEGGLCDSSTQVDVPHSTKHGSAPSHYRAPSYSNRVRQSEQPRYIYSPEELIPKSEVAKRSVKLCDQKTLKVRIKVGSDNLSMKKNAAIYCGLGLDVSPSSSFDDSPIESKKMYQGQLFSFNESPSQTIRMMSSFPIGGGCLLSPLSVNLVRLNIKERHTCDASTQPASKASKESSVLGKQFNSIKCNRMFSREQTKQSVKKSGLSAESKNAIAKDSHDDFDFLLKKEADIDTVACLELVSNALKLPLLSNSYIAAGDSVKESPGSYVMPNEGKQDMLKELSSDMEKVEPIEANSLRRDSWSGKPIEKAISSEKDAHGRLADLQSDITNFCREGKDSKGEAANGLTNIDVNGIGFSSSNTLMIENTDPQQQMAGLRSTCYGQEEAKLPTAKEQLPSRGKKKPKESPILCSQATGLCNGDARTVALEPKDSACKSELKKTVPQKDFGKAKDKYKDFFGDMNELGHDIMKSPDSLSEDWMETFQVAEKRRYPSENILRDRSNSKGTHELFNSEGYPKGTSNIPPVGKIRGSMSDPAPAGVDMDDSWVCCDKCQKWRLLPHGTKVDSLPERWICSMMTWMPGMNRCTISEEETNKALRAIYQLPPVNEDDLCGPLDGSVSGVTSAKVLYPNYNHQNFVPSGGKKKHGLKEITNASQQDGLNLFLDSKKKIRQSLKNKSLTNAGKSPLVNDIYFQHASNSTDTYAGTNRRKKKDRHRSLDCFSDEGHTKNPKIKSDKEPNQDRTRPSKKSKTRDMHLVAEDWTTSQDQGHEMLHPSSGYDLPTKVAWNGQLTNHEHSSPQNSKCDKSIILGDAIKNSKFRVLSSMDVASLNSNKSEDSNVTKKRKVNNSLDTMSHSAGKVISDDELVRVKKGKMDKPEGKESSARKGTSGTEKRGKITQQHQLGEGLKAISSLGNCDDLAAAQPAVATSSSSKVSGSCKAKSIFQEVKGSPVESVSSSPFRSSNSNRFTPVISNPMEKDNGQDVGLSVRASPKECLDAEHDDGTARSGTTRNDAFKIVAGHVSLTPSMRDLQDRNDSRSLDIIDKGEIATFPGHPFGHSTDGHADISNKGTQYPSETQSLGRCLNEVTRSSSHHDSKSSHSRRYAKDSSSPSKDKNEKFKSEADKSKFKMNESYNDSQDLSPTYNENLRNIEINGPREFGLGAVKSAKDFVGKKDWFRNVSTGGCRKDCKLDSVGHDDSDAKADAVCSHDAKSMAKQYGQQDYDQKRSSKKFGLEQADQMGSTSVREKLPQLPSHAGNRSEILNHFQGQYQGNGADTSTLDTRGNAVALRDTKTDKKNRTQYATSKHLMSNGHGVKDCSGPSPVRRDSSSQAASNVLKEAKDLKHHADRLKNNGSAFERTGFYFQAALKFLHGASLLESNNNENAKHAEMIQSTQIYSSTAKLCEFCAHEFEKSKDMAAAALAYKCMEVAYMRVICSLHSVASRDRYELQNSAQIVPVGESSSSSASDIDNSNNPATGEKVVQASSGSSPQPAGNHVIAAQNHPNFLRLLNFAQDVNFAMEASRKSRLAFAAANMGAEQAHLKEGISSTKRALDFNFHDVESLLRLVRLAMEAISH